ncbi:MAG: LysR family transcriptional regulator [Hydrogenophaga sp.]|uniref:LysR family transcriptional regulator n=1 Tax=Hydrogenophaga sp. TaxID=1904254 RepID=UPI002AB85AB9|nr:LysR family transcriptional regulator [Hydrogenophaga sp.]MDZ4188898.1 LysR family transcriptional regulator [Hydrogenophaga sp.]
MHPLHTTSWDWIKSFVAVAQHGSVLAAAQHLQTNPATVSRQIASLEQSLGVELFVRSRQGMQPTLPAMQFLEPARAMHAAMHQLSLGAAAKDEQVQGLVRISVSVSLAHFVLPELLDVFRSQHSGIHFEITATDSVSNLSQREADIAIRLLPPKQQDLIAKRVGYLSIGLFASQRYISRRGMPKMEHDNLMQHDFIDVAPQLSLREGFAKAGFAQLAERIVCTTTDHANSWHMLRAGIGIGSGLSILAERDSQIVPVLQEATLPKFPVWLVTHRELKTQPRLRLVMDYLAQALKSLAS